MSELDEQIERMNEAWLRLADGLSDLGEAWLRLADGLFDRLADINVAIRARRRLAESDEWISEGVMPLFPGEEEE